MAGGGELPLVVRPLLGAAPAPGRVQLQERVFDEVAPFAHRRKGSRTRVGVVRVGLVSPYSYTYPGGVGRHVEALAEELLREGHDVRLLAPYDPDDRHARTAHRGARPQRRPLPDYLVPLGRTIGLPMN